MVILPTSLHQERSHPPFVTFNPTQSQGRTLGMVSPPFKVGHMVGSPISPQMSFSLECMEPLKVFRESSALQTTSWCMAGGTQGQKQTIIMIRMPSSWQVINQSINQTSIAQITPAKPGSVARQPNQCSGKRSLS